MKNYRALHYLVFAVLMMSTVLGVQFLWGLLFIFWTIQNFQTRHAFLLFSVSQDDDPVLFWLIQLAWLIFGVLMVAPDAMIIFS